MCVECACIRVFDCVSEKQIEIERQRQRRDRQKKRETQREKALVSA